MTQVTAAKQAASHDDLLASVFEERAEHLSPLELASWTTYTNKDEAIIQKLMGPGAKLLIGPRGSGKSTLLRTAYFRLQDGGDALAAYVNYAKSLALEPLFHKQANALQLFRHWLVMKIVLGVNESLRSSHLDVPEDLARMASYAKSLVQQLENGLAPKNVDNFVAPSQLVELLEEWSLAAGLRRCVLLLDDAAHAFSPEQQREFFEVFRELRSRRVSGKAAVYPGITSYSPNFHVGHEAELLEAWYRPGADDYLNSMRSLVEKRLPDSLKRQLTDRQELVDYLALAAFGLPRGFLNMLSQLFGVDEDSAKRPTRSRADAAVSDHAESVRGLFRALAAKLPRFRFFVEVGKELEAGLTRVIREYNALQGSPSKKATVVAIEEPITPELERMLNMLEYAGVVRRLGSVSRGVKGRFQRYAVHHAILVADNALSLGKSFSTATVVEALSTRDAHAFTRTRDVALVGADYRKKCRLDLPPCANCGTPRIAEDQHFCMRCGSELTNASVYEELLRAPISELPLTRRKLDGILEHTPIKTIQDVLLDDEAQTVRKVPYIGPIWAARIRTYAEEFVSV